MHFLPGAETAAPDASNGPSTTPLSITFAPFSNNCSGGRCVQTGGMEQFSVAQARSDANNARVWGGLHYPSTVHISDALGEAIATYVNRHAMKPLRGGHDDDGK